MISKLAAVGDLSSVRTLIIPGQRQGTGNLTTIAGIFPNLERLFTKPDSTVDGDTRRGTDLEHSIASIQAFRPLKYLCLYSLCSVENLHKIIERHGQSLRGLIIEPSGTAQFDYPRLAKPDIERLAAACPNIQELRIQIKRSNGSRLECELYDALGQISNLHTLILDLNFDGQEAPPTRPHGQPQRSCSLSDVYVRNTFINAATDEKLALGIWNLITANKSSCLGSLRIVPFGSIGFPPPEKHMLSQLARSFLITGYNAQSPGLPMIKEIHPESKISWGPHQGPGDIRDSPRISREFWISRSEAVTSIIHELWPQLRTSDDWKSDLTSFPLEASTM